MDAYARLARFYDRLLDPMQAGVRRVALDVLPPDPSWRVLDVGCGTGVALEPYVDAGCQVSGVDLSPAMLAHAEERLGDRADLRLGDGRTLPYDDDSFDLVMTSMVLHEVPAESRMPFLAEMARVVGPDGRLLCIDFRTGDLRGWRGPVMRGVSTVIERMAGHHGHFRTYMTGGGLPVLVRALGMTIEREKPVAGGNLAVWIVEPPGDDQALG